MKRIHNTNYSTASTGNGTVTSLSSSNMKNMKYRIYALHEERKRIKERRKLLIRLIGFMWVCFILFVRRKWIRNRTDIDASTTTKTIREQSTTANQYNLDETNATSDMRYSIPTLDTIYNKNMNDTVKTDALMRQQHDGTTTTRAITLTNNNKEQRNTNAIIKTSQKLIRQISVSSKKIVSFFIVHPVQQIWLKLQKRMMKKGRKNN